MNFFLISRISGFVCVENLLYFKLSSALRESLRIREFLLGSNSAVLTASLSARHSAVKMDARGFRLREMAVLRSLEIHAVPTERV